MTVLSNTIFIILLTSFLLMTFSIQKVESFRNLQPEPYNQFKKKVNCHRTKMENFAVKENQNVNIVDYIDPHYDCNIKKKNIIQKIPYQLTSLSNSCDAVDVNFSSACIRCGMCLAIAQQINKTLIDFHESMIPFSWLNETEASNLLRTICHDSFKQLRALNGNYQISDRIPGSTLVPSSVDELWENQLRNKCHDYLREMGSMRLYEHWQRWCNTEKNDFKTPDLYTVLCRDDSALFRDCKSITEDYSQKKPLEDFETRVKVFADF